MSSWLDRIPRIQIAWSHETQLVVTALISAAVAAGAVYGVQGVRRLKRVETLKDSIPDIDEDHPATKLNEFGAAADALAPSKEDERSIALATRARQGDYDADIILEQLARNRVFLGDEGLSKLRDAFVIVIGLGGVGSHCAAALVRSGVSYIRLIDFDQVTLSSLNRHAVATLADVGTPKVHCIRKRLEQITPWVQFDCRNELFHATTAARQLEPFHGKQPTYVIDAIDNIDSKVALLYYCAQNGIKVISSMGAGCKSDPTRVFLGDISASAEDPLSRTTRRRLKIMGVKEGVPVVFSSEKMGPNKAQLMPLPEEEFQKGSVGELGVLPDFRVRILPVLGTMPAVFGLALANHIILDITGYPHEYLPSKAREKMYEGIHNFLQGQEERLARANGDDAVGLRIPLTHDDVGYLVEEIFRGKSVITGLSTKLVLTRWRKPPADSLDMRWQGQKYSRVRLTDLVCMTKEEAAKHERAVLKGAVQPEDLYEKDVVELVNKRLEEEAHYEKYR